MQLSFKTRQAARDFHSKRQAKGLPGRIVDHTKKQDGEMHVSRYAVTLR